MWEFCFVNGLLKVGFMENLIMNKNQFMYKACINFLISPKSHICGYHSTSLSLLNN